MTSANSTEHLRKTKYGMLSSPGAVFLSVAVSAPFDNTQYEIACFNMVCCYWDNNNAFSYFSWNIFRIRSYSSKQQIHGPSVGCLKAKNDYVLT